MSGVRVLVGTRKGAFILTSNEKRKRWKVSGPHFAGWEIYHLNGSPVDPDRLYASQSNGWFGQVIQRSSDGGQTWETPGGGPEQGPDGMPHGESNKFVYEGEVGTHQWYDGTQHPWEFKRVWQLKPSLTDPDTVYAGVEDAALFKSIDGGTSWQELAGLARSEGSSMAARCRRDVPAHDFAGSRQSRSDLRGHLGRGRVPHRRWRPDVATDQPRPQIAVRIAGRDAEVGHCVHNIAMHPSRPNVLFMQKHWDVNRSDDAGDSWHEVSGNLPSDFGFPIAVHAHEPETIYVVPIKSDSEHYPPDGKLRVYRSRIRRQ